MLQVERRLTKEQYYIGVPLSENDGKGAGPFMYASVEMEMWKGS